MSTTGHTATRNDEREASEHTAQLAARSFEPAQEQRIRIIYIRSTGHSGSTLLDMLISSHDDVFSMGSVKNWAKKQHKRCTCSDISVADCPFWRAVDAHLQEHEGLSFSELDPQSGDPEIFRRHNLALFRAVQHVSGKPVIVDSSKSVERVLKLLRVAEFDVRIIQLERHPLGVVYSNIRKRRNYRKRARKICRSFVHSRLALEPYTRMHVRYELLAKHPKSCLQQIMEHVDLPFQEQQLNWAGRERHNIGGNRMRVSNDSTIRVDSEWRRALSNWRKSVIFVQFAIVAIARPLRFLRALSSTRTAHCRRLELREEASEIGD